MRNIIVGALLTTGTVCASFFSSCQLNRHIGCTCLYNGEQVELIKYLGKGFYKVRPIKDTVTIIVNEQDLE